MTTTHICTVEIAWSKLIDSLLVLMLVSICHTHTFNTQTDSELCIHTNDVVTFISFQWIWFDRWCGFNIATNSLTDDIHVSSTLEMNASQYLSVLVRFCQLMSDLWYVMYVATFFSTLNPISWLELTDILKFNAVQRESLLSVDYIQRTISVRLFIVNAWLCKK